MRKDAKKLRYLLECFGGLLAGGERKAFVKRLKALQDNLGEHQDAEVHADKLRTVADELPATTAGRRRSSPSASSSSSSSATRAGGPRRRSPTASPSTTASRPARRCATMLDGAGG